MEGLRCRGSEMKVKYKLARDAGDLEASITFSEKAFATSPYQEGGTEYENRPMYTYHS